MAAATGPTLPAENEPQSEPTLTRKENQEIKDGARWLRRVTNPFVDFYVILAIGATGSSTAAGVARQHEDSQTRDHAKDLTPIQRKIYAEDFDSITSHLPFLKNRLESDVPTKFLRKVIIRAQSTASQGRQSDTKSIKQTIVTLLPLPLDQTGIRPVNIVNPGTSKAWRGWQNLTTARLLCPADHLAEFDTDPETARAKLRDGKLSLVDTKGDPKLPAFLYDEEVMDGSLVKGLFRGQLLLKVYKLIFIAPSAATGAKASLKRGNARIHGMEKVIPSTICYTAIQVYVALCCCREWKEEWKGIKFARLYMLLREQFAYPDDPWHSKTLNWWNEQVFGASDGTDEDIPETARDAGGPSTRERGDYEREQRMQAAAGN
ncbi:hypothetical protein BJ322DRAFT_1107959 [Thelephora terrestris]|uniref:Uncharacterized protein n=1 Tax=Thelephora terrestris TaxID=56493 RepID=A0A9P6L7K2_9AGAM|nr:hypothetical protein BJ322DRAFT_1107959 [Thelephora terrestris]